MFCGKRKYRGEDVKSEPLFVQTDKHHTKSLRERDMLPYTAIFVINALVCTLVYELSNKPPRGTPALDLSTTLDAQIPYVEVFVIPYLLWFVYLLWAFGCLIRRANLKSQFMPLLKLLIPMNFAVLLCATTFLFWQTEVKRPPTNLPETALDVCGWMMLVVWTLDSPFNGFPSLHVLSSSIICAHFCKKTKTSLAAKVAHVAVATIITLSTLFTKQHYIADVVAAILLSFPLNATPKVLLFWPTIKKGSSSGGRGKQKETLQARQQFAR